MPRQCAHDTIEKKQGQLGPFWQASPFGQTTFAWRQNGQWEGWERGPVIRSEVNSSSECSCGSIITNEWHVSGGVMAAEGRRWCQTQHPFPWLPMARSQASLALHCAIRSLITCLQKSTVRRVLLTLTLRRVAYNFDDQCQTGQPSITGLSASLCQAAAPANENIKDMPAHTSLLASLPLLQLLVIRFVCTKAQMITLPNFEQIDSTSQQHSKLYRLRNVASVDCHVHSHLHRHLMVYGKILFIFPCSLIIVIFFHLIQWRISSWL